MDSVSQKETGDEVVLAFRMVLPFRLQILSDLNPPSLF
ncbi:MAG: hypothetical protein TRG1_3217 [Flavobacteriaceae bacterium FS1-H7996/R]|nr:MAG: hypothetical protein TRG1_3217 [Flavobacteriaceae bacterium FS1-H7996/R]